MLRLKFFLLVYFSITIFAFSQENNNTVDTKFIINGKIWANGLLGHDFTTHELYPVKSNFIKIQGDTLINEVIWYKIYKSIDEYQSDWEAWGFIREEAKKIYYKWDGEEQRLLYDFGLEAGEQIELLSTNFIVDSVKNEIVFNKSRKHYYLSIGDNPDIGKIVWIEGIGSTGGFFENTGNLLSDGGVNVLLCCMDNNTQIYNNLIYNTCFFSNSVNVPTEKIISDIQIYPNPTNNFVNIKFGETLLNNISLNLYSSDGKLLFKKNNVRNNQMKLNISDYSRGFYYLNISDEFNVKTLKIIKL